MERICTMCGKKFDVWDEQQNFVVDREIGYGSKYDYHHIQMNLCCDCFDRVVDYIVDNSKTNPLTESDWL